MENQMISKLAVFLTSFITVLLSMQAHYTQADELCTLPEMRNDQRPGHDGPPTEITLGVLVADITGIDDVEQTITGDFIVEMQWKDERLAEQAGCRFPISKVWDPRMELVNSYNLTAKRNFQQDQVEVEDGGQIYYYQRYFGAIATYHHLAQFPFDSQVFQLRIISIDFDEDELVIKPDTEFTQVASLINIADWTIGEVQANVEGIHMAELRSPRSIFILEIPAVRNSNFYIWKVLVPLTLIVMMSWAVFWINPVKFGPQLGLSATAMLTLIAFQFAQTGVLPKLSYFTTMDKLILGSSLLVFLSFFEAAFAIYLVSKGAEKAAIHMDIACRWIFPLLFILYWTIIIVI